MFDTINGIPLHPLVVHAVVVLLPLSVVGTLAIVGRPAWRRPYGPLVVAAAVIATALCPVATASGEEFKQRVGVNPAVHQGRGEVLVWFGLALVVTTAALVWLDRRPADRRPGKPVMTAVAALAVVAAVAAGIQVVLVGDSGARAAWGGFVTSGS